MRILPALALLCIVSHSAIAQTIDQGYTIEQYVTDVLIGDGVNVSNITFSGSEEQIGYMSGADAVFTVGAGVVLSSDHATHLTDPGCADSNMCQNCEGLGNDPDLLSVANSVPPLIGQAFTVSSVHDLCILEFDFEASGDSIAFNYVFGSDEYLEWVNSTYNDIFAFFLSGPGIVGPYSAPAGFPDGAINIAQVPNSDPLLPITISSVNDVTNPEYYVDNFANNGICIDGYTETFTASAVVECGGTYHIKIAIADGSDSALESFVILEEGSFSSNAVDLIADASLEGAEVFLGDTTVVEGCNDATFTVIRPDDSGIDTIFLNVYGTATMGGDFSNTFDMVIFADGESSADITLGVINDNLIEGPEWVTLEYTYINGCGDTIITSATIVIFDPQPVTLFTEPVSCLDELNGITLSVDPLTGFLPYEYQWDTDAGDTDASFYYDTGGTSGTATVTVTDICGSIAEAEVTWEMLDEFIGEDETICLGQTSTVPATGGTQNAEGHSGFSDILTEVQDEDGNWVWTSIIGVDTLVYFHDNTNQITNLYDGLYSTGDGGIGNIEVQLIDGCGNITYSTLTIEICQLEFFNVFTPNNDGDNDYFNILGLQGYPNSQLIVYDRWGALVYSNLNYLGAWRGLNNKGKPLADGTYYFTLTVGHTDDEELEYLGEVVTDLSVDGIVKFSGSVTIFR
jgi:gliding motility-associated-like protein